MSRKNRSNNALFHHLLHDKTDRAYNANLLELRSRSDREIFVRAKEWATSDAPKKQLAGVQVLSQLGGLKQPFKAEVLDVYFELLRKPLPEDLLESVLYGIAHNNFDLDEERVQVLLPYRHHADKAIREALVWALLGINHKPAIAMLIQLSRDKVDTIRDWATFGLGQQTERNNKAIRAALWDRVDDPHNDTRAEAIMGLALRKEARVGDVIRREVEGGSPGTLIFEAAAALHLTSLLASLQALYAESAGDESINPRWLEDLRCCIATLVDPQGMRWNAVLSGFSGAHYLAPR